MTERRRRGSERQPACKHSYSARFIIRNKRIRLCFFLCAYIFIPIIFRWFEIFISHLTALGPVFVAGFWWNTLCDCVCISVRRLVLIPCSFPFHCRQLSFASFAVFILDNVLFERTHFLFRLSISVRCFFCFYFCFSFRIVSYHSHSVCVVSFTYNNLHIVCIFREMYK